jgi:hypothetical protein
MEGVFHLGWNYRRPLGHCLGNRAKVRLLLQSHFKPMLTLQSIPNFNDLLGIVSSLFASWFTYGISGIFWLFVNKGRWFSTPSRAFLTFANWTLIIVAAAICGIGLYASGMAIRTSDGKGAAWSCKSA